MTSLIRLPYFIFDHVGGPNNDEPSPLFKMESLYYHYYIPVTDFECYMMSPIQTVRVMVAGSSLLHKAHLYEVMAHLQQEVDK